MGAACVCATSAQVLVGGYAVAINPAPSSQFHAQDEFGQFSFGHAGGPPAPTNTSTPTVSSRLSTTSLTLLTDSELPEPTFPSPVLPPLLSPLPLPFSTFPSPSLLKTPPRLLLPPRRLLRGRDVMLMR